MKASTKRNEKLRIIVLAMTLGCTLLAVGKLAIAPPGEKRQEMVFPNGAIPLSGWNYRESRNLQEPDGKLYRYEEGDRVLEIEMRQIAYTDGNIEHYWQRYKDLTPSFRVKQQENVGLYILFMVEERAYLSSCINPSGPSTATVEQFRHNRNTHDLQWHRIVLWMLGRSDLRQWNCLWVNVSILLEDVSQEEIDLKLEKAWFEWYNWWESRYP